MEKQIKQLKRDFRTVTVSLLQKKLKLTHKGAKKALSEWESGKKSVKK